MDAKIDPTEALTWAMLLARWLEFARSSTAFPREGAWGVVRESVPDLIALQALCMALQHLDDLAPDERAIGLDRAAVLIDKHASAILQRPWPQGVPPALQELILDARNLWQQASLLQKSSMIKNIEPDPQNLSG